MLQLRRLMGGRHYRLKRAWSESDWGTQGNLLGPKFSAHCKILQGVTVMFKAVLFDLDGTLLDIDMDDFLKHYFTKMISMASGEGYQEARHLAERIFQSTAVMIANRDSSRTNEEVFMADFYQHWPYSPEQFTPFFERFYEEGFPTLQSYCKPFPGVARMMDQLYSKGIKVVIATNAVFPKSALMDRLEWAEVGHHPYDLITSYEIMHFCKPHLEYYEEICDRISVHPTECLMVGNDVGEDIIAGKLGMKTFLVENRLIDQGDRFNPDWRGYWPDFFNFIKAI